jgi:cytidylate kinase
MLGLLDKAFNTMGVDRAWVAVPFDNQPAIGLFEKLGFDIDNGRVVKHGAIDVVHMTVSSRRYSARASRAHKEQTLTPVVAITGLPGSESESLGREIARLLESEFIGDDIKESLCKRLQCSKAELESFENSYKSFWSRLLASIVVPTEIGTAYESGYHAYIPSQSHKYDELLAEPITKDQYRKKLRRIVRRHAAEGNAVLHGNASHLFLPDGVDGLTVFVSDSAESRAIRVAQGDGKPEDSLKRLESIDREHQQIFAHLFDCAIDDPSKFDITVNLDRMSIKDAAELVVDVLQRRVSQKDQVPAAQSIRINS